MTIFNPVQQTAGTTEVEYSQCHLIQDYQILYDSGFLKNSR
jgi:hypothetical protein